MHFCIDATVQKKRQIKQDPQHSIANMNTICHLPAFAEIHATVTPQERTCQSDGPPAKCHWTSNSTDQRNISPTRQGRRRNNLPQRTHRRSAAPQQPFFNCNFALSTNFAEGGIIISGRPPDMHVYILHKHVRFLISGLAQVGLPQWDINRIIQSIDVDDSGNVSYTGNRISGKKSGSRHV